MYAHHLNEILGDPLAGCLPLVSYRDNYTALRSAIKLRLRIFYSAQRVNALVKTVEQECKKHSINKYEYVINEMQYELRTASRRIELHYTDNFETAVLNTWGHRLIKRYEENTVLDFISDLKFWRCLR